MSRGARAAFAAVAAVAVAVLSGSGCVDTTPGEYVKVMIDAGAPLSPDAGRAAACAECFRGDGGACHAAYEACAQYPTCTGTFDCALASGCITLDNTQDRATCAANCLATHALPTGDPLVLLAQLNVCVDGACKSACLQQ